MSKMEVLRLEVARLEAEGRKVIVIFGSDGLALSALAGTGGLVTVLIDKVEEVEEVEESRDWSLWQDEELEAVEARCMPKVTAEDFNVRLRTRNEVKDVSDAKLRKAWQTCYGPATRKGKRDKHDFKGRPGRNSCV